MNLTAVIPVRENPDGRLPQKCLLPFKRGYNLTEWKIRQLITVLDPHQIVLSTNSERLKEAGRRFGTRIRRHRLIPQLHYSRPGALSRILST